MPKPGYLIVKADIAKGVEATDELLELTPGVREAWVDRVMAYRRGELTPAASEADLPTYSILDDLSDLWNRKVKGSKPEKKKAFDFGAVILDGGPGDQLRLDGGGGGSEAKDEGGGGSRSAGAPEEAEEEVGYAERKRRADATKVEGNCVICFAEKPP